MNIDMPIVGTSSSEKQIDVLVAESLQGDELGVNLCSSLKRSRQDLEGAQVEKRVKVENNVGLSCNPLHENGVDPAVPVRGVGGCQDTNLGNELTKEKGVNSTAVGNGTDLSDLLRGLDGSSDSEEVDDEEFGGDPLSWPNLEVDIPNELAENGNVNITEVQAHAPLVKPIDNAVDSSSELEKRGDIGTELEAHETMRKEKSSPEVIMLDSDSDNDEDLVIFVRQDDASQLKNAVQSEPGGSRQVPKESSQLENTVMQEPGGLRHVPNGSPQVGKSVKVEHGSTRQVPKESSQLENTVMQEPGGLRHVPNGSPQVGKSVKVEHGSTRQMPNGSLQVENSVKVEHESTRQVPSGNPQVGNAVKVEHGSTRQAPHSMQSSGLQAGTMQKTLTAEQQQAGSFVQMRIVNGKLEPYIVTAPVTPHNATRTRMSPFSGNAMHPVVSQAYSWPVVNYPSGGLSTSCAPIKGYAPEATSGELAGRSLGLNPPTTSATVSSSEERAGPSHAWNSSTTSPGVSSSGDRAGPSHARNPPSTLAVVPFNSGPCKAEPGLPENTNLGPHNVSAHDQLAVVKPCYDSTVSTPRLNVARAMLQYDFFITKAKNDMAQSASTRNEFVKEGNRRGLECRPDIVAYNDMKREFGNVNPDITVGELPGVEVGDRFTYRHQMAVVGLHRLPNVGIDYGHPPPDMIPTATAIVLMPKAGYVDDKDYGNTILYTGQGGRKKRNQAAPFVCDQELKKGNLALAKNYERKLPVRVIRGHTVLGGSGPGFLGYTYDGLYVITNYEFSKGINGFNVFKYSLERLEGQPPIPPCISGCTAHEWNKARGALGAMPLQAVDPLQQSNSPAEEDVKQLCV